MPAEMRALHCLDEYERLVKAFSAGWGEDLLDYLRHTFQHRPQIALIPYPSSDSIYENPQRCPVLLDCAVDRGPRIRCIIILWQGVQKRVSALRWHLNAITDPRQLLMDLGQFGGSGLGEFTSNLARD